MALTTTSVQENIFDRTSYDDKTQKIASQIVELANGLTCEQFTNAVKIALIDVSLYGRLSLQPVR